LRTLHFPKLRVPALFVHGTADPFGTMAELETAIATIPARTRIIPVEKAGHDLKRGRFDLTAVAEGLCALASLD
jgi:predicted alpha/beta-hydrolase family hydrolase